MIARTSVRSMALRLSRHPGRVGIVPVAAAASSSDSVKWGTAAAASVVAAGIGGGASAMEPQRRNASSDGKEKSDKTEEKGDGKSFKFDWIKTMDWDKTSIDEFMGKILSDGDKGQEEEQQQSGGDEASKESPSGFEGVVESVKSVFGGVVDSAASNSEPSAPTPKSNQGFLSLAQKMSSVLSGGDSEDAVRALIEKASQDTDAGDVTGSKSFIEQWSLLNTHVQEVTMALNNSFRDMDFSDFDPTSLFYFLEREDEWKNPSWKRMKHRYCRGVDLRKVHDLNDALVLSELSYADTVDEIKEGLAKDGKWELLYCNTESLPGKPSHFLALKKDQSRWGNTLEVLLVVRGTKSLGDLFSDALLESEDYRSGKAHSGIVRCGKYLVEKHEKTLQKLLLHSKKGRLKVTLIGHSLGAGAASIAGMEYRARENTEVTVTGFGCPALLSKELSESTKDFITTVVGDSDVIPRMSAATIANVALDVMEYDWTAKGRRDVEQALLELRSNAPLLISPSDVDVVMGFVDAVINKYVRPPIREPTTKRMTPILFPPGSIVHFYRDGSGISGSYTPCSFFNEIDVSRTMIDDHIISGYRRIFLDLMRDFHNDEHFAFDKKKR